MPDEGVRDPLLGQHLDEYRLEAMIGTGAMGRVYRAFDVRLKRPAAVKIINALFQADSEYMVRFEREAQAIAQIKHPHIVSVYRYGEANGFPYIAMEFIEGVTLASILEMRSERLPAAEISRMIHQLCQALDYAHGLGVIHRDIKPSNIMLNKQGEVILTDFGLVRLAGVGTKTGFLGTPPYMAPEQVISSADAIPQSDLYAVGVILYELFTEELPFQGSSPFEIARKHIEEAPPPPRDLKPDLSPALEAVLLKSLAKKPEERYASGAALAEALERALEPNQTNQTWVSSAKEPEQAGVGNGERIKRYHIRHIRDLLTEGFTAEELRRFAFDISSFRQVYHQLAESTGKAKIIDYLLEYAEQTVQIDPVLAWAKAQNPAQYAQHEPYYEFVNKQRPLILPVTIGQRYTLTQQMGRSGIAEVYQAEQFNPARTVAVKIIHGYLTDNEIFIERFQDEAATLGSLRHPNIVEIIENGHDEELDLYYMVLEFIDGPTLETELKQRQGREPLFSPAEIVNLFKALAGAIDYAHTQGVIHRDLKPGNLMFTANRQVKLTDFSLAHLVNLPGHTVVTNTLVGTPAYMSPEQAQGQPVDQRSDIYSLGVILYELITGRVPFPANSPAAVFMRTASEPPPLPPNLNLPAAIAQVIRKALSYNPNDRYPTAGEMAQALAKAIRQHQSKAESVGEDEDKKMPNPEALTSTERQRLKQEQADLVAHLKTLANEINELRDDLIHETRREEQNRLKNVIEKRESLQVEFQGKLGEIERRLKHR